MSADKSHEYKTKEQRDAEALKEKQDRQHAIRIKEFRSLLGDRSFRRHIWRMVNLCGVYRISWDPSARIHFNEGMRWVGLEILNDINEADPNVEGLMRKEALEDENANGK